MAAEGWITQSQSHKVDLHSHTKYCHWKLLTQKQIKEFLNLLVLAYMCGICVWHLNTTDEMLILQSEHETLRFLCIFIDSNRKNYYHIKMFAASEDDNRC